MPNEETDMNINLGNTYEDLVTGFRGVAVGHVEYMTGCNQTLLSPRARPDGSIVESQWFDDQRLKVDELAPTVMLDNGETPGCDKPAPIR